MNKFFTSLIKSKGYELGNNSSLQIFKNGYEFFILEHFEVEEFANFFKSEKMDYLISEFQTLDNDKEKKNTSLFVLIKVDNLQLFYNQYLPTIITIEEDEYYFRKYVIFYTEEGLNKLKPNVEYLLEYINSESPDEKSLFDKFEENMFFDDAYFVAMQLIVKLPFISLPHSDTHFETIEDRTKSRIDVEKLVKQEEQVNQILELLNGDNIGEQLKSSAILGRLGEILET